jgi:hypothetical protein
LLLDTWSEALLSTGSGVKSSKWNKSGSGQVQIRGEVAPILEAVVKTLRLLVKHFKKNSLDLDEVSQVRSSLDTIFATQFHLIYF